MSFEGNPLPFSPGAAENSWRQLRSGEGGSRQSGLSGEVCVGFSEPQLYKKETQESHLSQTNQGTGDLGRYEHGGSTLRFKDDPSLLGGRVRLAQSKSRLATKSLSSPFGELPRKQDSSTFWRRGCGPCAEAEDKKWGLIVSSTLRLSSCQDLRNRWKVLLFPCQGSGCPESRLMALCG